MSRVGSRVALGVACTLALAGCGSLGESASSLGNTIVMGGPPPPPDGSTLVKIGVEGRALVGVSGSAGRFDVPLRFVVNSGSTVFADHSRRTSVSIPAGSTQGTFILVEDGIVVPPAAAQDFAIEVGLGGGPAGGGRRRG